tara:strand:- start:200 stop:310 length:111 start_codon:yes stop_codon:yes gene_type:complete
MKSPLSFSSGNKKIKADAGRRMASANTKGLIWGVCP